MFLPKVNLERKAAWYKDGEADAMSPVDAQVCDCRGGSSGGASVTCVVNRLQQAGRVGHTLPQHGAAPCAAGSGLAEKVACMSLQAAVWLREVRLPEPCRCL